MIPAQLTLDDLEMLAHRYGGTVETHERGFILRGVTIDGRTIDLGPVPRPVTRGTDALAAEFGRVTR